MEKKICSECNREITEDNYLVYDRCPYAIAMGNSWEEEDLPIIEMCSACYEDRLGDI